MSAASPTRISFPGGNPPECVDAQSYDELRRLAANVVNSNLEIDRDLLREHLKETSPVPASNDLAEVRGTAPGTGGDLTEVEITHHGVRAVRRITSPEPVGTEDASFTGVPAAGEGENQSPAGATAAGVPSAQADDDSTPPRDAAPAGGDGPDAVLAAALRGQAVGTSEFHAVRLLKALNDAGFHVLRESELDAIVAARSAV